ncbi:MAG: hypothetical protein ACR2GW_11765, partial [Pyrinomonadaceae bacterium]
PLTVLDYLARREGVGREIAEAVALNARTPDESMAVLARQTADGSLLEIVMVNQQRLIRAPQILEAVLANPARTVEAERRAREVKREFFEKERGAQQIAEEMRARGMTAAAEFIEAAESIGADESGLTIDDAWLIAEHIEVSDADIDDSWLPSEYLEELLAESEEQRAANIERLLAETQAEVGEIAPERVSLIRRVMLMSVKDRVKLAMKGDRETRAILIRDANRTVGIAVLHNPRLTEQEVEAIAAMRTVDSEVLRLVANNRAWARAYSVILNLARNPRTPLTAAISILPRIRTKELQGIAQNRNVSDAVRRQANRLALTRGGH